jgi:hypothetical protein
MTFDLSKILQSKGEFRRRAAARPIEEKLALLDALRERALTLRPIKSNSNAVNEEATPYRVSETKSE